MATLTGAVWFIARLSLVAMFPFSALDKIWHWRNALAQTESDGLPGAPTLLVLAILVEGLTPFCILFGWMDRPAALLLAGFCVVTAFLYHPFWAYPDFFDPSDASKSREHFWQFLKNFGLVGGLILVAAAGTLSSPLNMLNPATWSSRSAAASRHTSKSVPFPAPASPLMTASRPSCQPWRDGLRQVAQVFIRVASVVDC